MIRIEARLIILQSYHVYQHSTHKHTHTESLLIFCRRFDAAYENTSTRLTRIRIFEAVYFRGLVHNIL